MIKWPRYTEIKAWQLADELALLLHKAAKEFPEREIWGLTYQMRGVAVSVPANIAEGSARRKGLISCIEKSGV